MTYLTFITAIALSSIAAFYSVIGLAQIFPGSFLPIVVMGATLEVAKLVTVSWLYNNWRLSNIMMKTYFIIAIILLMAITSMGIFGFLSKAHMDTSLNVGMNDVQLNTLKQREIILKEKLNYLLKKAGNDPEKISRRTDAQIQEVQKELVKLNEEKVPFLKESNKLKAEVGPIKYIAELIYEKTDDDLIDKAVRLVILIIIFVFDPLAILLLVAANQSYSTKKTIDKILVSGVESIPRSDIFEIKPKDLK